MRIPIFTSASAIILGLALTASPSLKAQSDLNTHTTKKTFGYLDSGGVFHAIQRVAPDPEVPARTFTGTLEVEVTVTLQTPLKTGESVVCEADFTASEIDGSATVVDYEETAIAGGATKATWNTPVSPDEGAIVVSDKVTGSRNRTSTPSPEVNPTKRYCDISIPYSWAFPAVGGGGGANASSSLVGDLSVSIVFSDKTNGAQTAMRSNQQAIPVTSFPEDARAATTKYPMSVTL